jgi:hypothetical protein
VVVGAFFYSFDIEHGLATDIESFESEQCHDFGVVNVVDFL